jgi:Zn-dependent protease
MARVLHNPGDMPSMYRVSWRGIRIGRLLGVDITADLSLALIVGLVTLGLGSGALASWHPDWPASVRYGVAAIGAVLLLVSLLAHEMAHARMALRHGIRVRRVTLFMFGGFAEMEQEPRAPRAEVAIAMVGPLASLAIGTLALALGAGLASERLGELARGEAFTLSGVGVVPTLLLWLGPLNIALGLFNLVPGFPLDGGRVLRAVLWWTTGDQRQATRWATAMGRGFATALMGVGIAMALGFEVPYLGRGLIDGLWLVLIGWFLASSARATYEQLIVRQELQDVPVAAVMCSAPLTVPAERSVADFVRNYVMQTDQRAFPVVAGPRLVGLACLEDVRKVPQSHWEGTTVERIMTPVPALVTMAPEEAAVDALRRLASEDVNQIPVVDEGRLLGLVRRSDIMKWLALRTSELPA